MNKILSIADVVPQNLKAENAILGILLTGDNCIHEVLPSLLPDLFYNDDNRRIYDAIAHLHATNRQVDSVTVLAALGNDINPLQLVDLMVDITSSAHIGSYVNILKECYMRRQIMQKSRLTLQMAAEGADIEDMLKVHSDLADHIDSLFSGHEGRFLPGVLREISDQLEMRVQYHEKGQSPYISTGLRSLDCLIDGWRNGCLYIVAARPSMGKTQMALHFAHTAASAGLHVAFFSLEMSDIQLTERLILAHTGLQEENFKSGAMTREDRNAFNDSLKELWYLPFYIDDGASLSVQTIRRRCYQLKRKKELDILFFDYLQLADGDRPGVSNREQEIAYLSRQMKILAKELDIPVVCLSQLSRETERRVNKIPILADLRESGGIEQDADVVMLLYRPTYYNPLAERSDGSSWRGKGDLIVAKNRHGKIGNALFGHDERFKNIFDTD